jgi:hypothetical protein
MRQLGLIFVGLLLGLAIYWYASTIIGTNEKSIETSSTVVTKLEKVFKIITAEGHFNEIYNYQQTKDYFHFIPSTKKALLIINAKVQMGYDFKKLKYRIDEKRKTIIFSEIPKAEILSVDPTYNFYNLEDGILNKFETNELNILQSKGKQKIINAVDKSELPSVAEKQLKLLITQFFKPSGWRIELASDAQYFNPFAND